MWAKLKFHLNKKLSQEFRNENRQQTSLAQYLYTTRKSHSFMPRTTHCCSKKIIIETNRSVMTKEQKFTVTTKCVQRQKFFSSYGNYTKQMMFDPTKEICFLFVPSFWKHCNGLLRSDTNNIQSISWSLDFIYFSVSKALFKTLQNNCRSVDRCVLWFINMSSSFGICRIDNIMPQATSHI